MALSAKYGRLDIPKIAEDEPVFVIRAQDTLAVPILKVYRALVTSQKLPVAQSLAKEIETFQGWPGSKKMPD